MFAGGSKQAPKHACSFDADNIQYQAVEVRLGPQGAKAKYVRVELRKIETLPAPPPNSFYSIVGSENPTVLWQASEEWGVLQTVSGIFMREIYCC